MVGDIWVFKEIPMRNGRASGMAADGTGWNLRCRKFEKRLKNRSERHRAKVNPECQPGYGKYRGWLT